MRLALLCSRQPVVLWFGCDGANRVSSGMKMGKNPDDISERVRSYGACGDDMGPWCRSEARLAWEGACVWFRGAVLPRYLTLSALRAVAVGWC